MSISGDLEPLDEVYRSFKGREGDWSSYDENDEIATQERYRTVWEIIFCSCHVFNLCNRSWNLRLYINSVWVIGLTIADIVVFFVFQVSQKFRHFGCEEIDNVYGCGGCGGSRCSRSRLEDSFAPILLQKRGGSVGRKGRKETSKSATTSRTSRQWR